MAMRMRSLELIRLLLEKGADPRFEWRNMTMLQLADWLNIGEMRLMTDELGWKERLRHWNHYTDQ